MDGMSFGEKKVFTIPKKATRLKASVIDEEDRLLVTTVVNDRFSQLVSILILLTLSQTVSLKFGIVRNLIGPLSLDVQIL